MQPFDISLSDGGKATGLSSIPSITPSPGPAARPLIIGIHGGTYNSAYFDAYPTGPMSTITDALSVPFIALDRPDCKTSTRPPPGTPGIGSLQQQGHYLASTVIPALWSHFGASSAATSIVLLAHSIGATVAMVAAANIDEAIPLAGLILHGIGAVGQPTFEDEQNAMGPAIEIGMQTGYVQLPVEQKNNAMLCLSESLGPRDVELRLDCHGKTPIADMFEVRESWFDWWRVVAGTIKVPVLYAIADHDLFWASQPLEGHPDPVAEFTDAFTSSSHVVAELWRHSPHCIEHSYMGKAFEARCCAFAGECAMIKAIDDMKNGSRG